MNDLAQALSNALEGEVRFDSYARHLYSTDASIYQIEPLGVVLPKHTADVQAALQIAAEYNVPVLPRGGGSGLAGQAIGPAVVLDFSKHMRAVLEINPDEHWARVQPGLVCDALNNALRPYNLMFGTEPASSNRATMGGVIGNNATGAHSVLYGMTIDHLLAANAYLADATPMQFAALDPEQLVAKVAAGGTEAELLRGVADLVNRHEAAIRERFPKTWRRSSGYSLNYLLPSHQTASQPANWYSPHPYPPGSGFNLAKLMAGSEGTLAILTEATLNLVPRPKQKGLCIVHFQSLVAAAEATPAILECQPSAVELLDALLIDLTRSVPGYAAKLTFIEGHPAAVQIVEFYGETEAEVLSKVEQLEARLHASGLAQTFVRALTPKQQADVWGIRTVGLGLLASMRGDAKPTTFMEDVAVPVAHLAEWVRATERIFAAHHVEAGYYAHASAGCLHIRPVLSLKKAAGVTTMQAISAEVLEVVIGLGGAMSGEHGDGLARSVWNGRLFGPELYQAFCDLKKLFDPQNRLNPGKIVEAPDLGDNLRYGPAYEALELKTILSFEKERGFAAAVEQCNGQGVCRKAEGTMCPSYQATREEEHSTRGRANALRDVLSGRLPQTDLTSPRLHKVMDLCLECKACKTECPSGVDMAKIKYEFLSQYQVANGVPLRSRMFAEIHALSAIAQVVAPVVNLAFRLPPVRWLNERVLGISRHRTLPPFAQQPFRSWFAAHLKPTPTPKTETVILLVDTFTNYNHPSIGIAAVRVLEAAGYRVQLADHGCCGRPMISKGLLTEARQAAAGNVAVLAEQVRQGRPVIGLEPSCLLTLRDEYLDLLPNDPRTRQVAQSSYLIEEFIASRADRFQPLFQNSDSKSLLLHGHCYQKALTSTEALKTMLGLPGWEVSEINSGCCGLAGSFGYEAEHYDVSMQVGEDRLFPAIRAAGQGVGLAASGMSCRHQIQHGTGRPARHPIEWLAEALA